LWNLWINRPPVWCKIKQLLALCPKYYIWWASQAVDKHLKFKLLNINLLLDVDCKRIIYVKIRVYDPRVQRRPVIDFNWLEVPIHALAICHRQNHILAGNNQGELALFDLRATSVSGEKHPRLIQKFRGFAGAIRCIDAHSSKPHFISCGIDRFSIVHDLDTKEIIKKIYCKTQLTCCLLRSENSLTLDKEKNVSIHRKRRKISATDDD